MPISDMILPEFDSEMTNTRKTLERVPDDKFDWRPHEKSFTMHDLAAHIANIPAWTAKTLNEDSFDVAPPDGSNFEVPKAKSTSELLEMFDKNVSEARKAITEADDERMMASWTLLKGGQELITLPRIAVLRGFILNHNVHHRGQLTVYFRLNNIPVPALYGRSADEEGI
jgi:uncharacterized damage-inducible protein DinB